LQDKEDTGFFKTKETILNEKIFNRELEHLRDPERLERLEIDRVVDLSIDGLQINSMLDIGTGTAVFAECFAKRNCGVAGIDINESMITEASRFVPTGVFKIGRAEKIPFDDQSFDLAFFGLVLHEADDMFQALREARRVARKRIAILEWPYEVGENGPPLEHRLKPVLIKDAARKAGINKFSDFKIKERVLYRMDLDKYVIP
jgi:2-polyprenyl-3-methyl-5-hydroxy-6-metoxy-1,4-benzoquinol methylase